MRTLDYNQWIDFVDTDDEAKKNKVKQLRDLVVWKNKEIQESLFTLLNEHKKCPFDYVLEHRDYEAPDGKKKPWIRRHYVSTKMHYLLREKIPQLKKIRHVTNSTADKIKELLDWMKYCEEALSKKEVFSHPEDVKETRESIVEWKNRWEAVQLTINFDESEKKTEDNSSENLVVSSVENVQVSPQNTEGFQVKEDIKEHAKEEKEETNTSYEVEWTSSSFDDNQDDIYARDRDEPWWNR